MTRALYDKSPRFRRLDTDDPVKDGATVKAADRTKKPKLDPMHPAVLDVSAMPMPSKVQKRTKDLPDPIKPKASRRVVKRKGAK